MKKGKTSTAKFEHEHKVEVDYSKGRVIAGHAFGKEDREDGLWYTISFTKAELESQGLKCSGPCINKQFHESRVTLIEEE
jgi:hypothetical protein